MQDYELRDPNEARRFLTQGLWWQRVRPPAAATVRQALGWAKALASEGSPLPPIGFLADVGHIALGEDWEARDNREAVAIPSLPINLLRTYEDHVLGKLYADWTFSRAGDALRGYTKGREQDRGLAFLLERYHERAGFPGVSLGLGVLTTLLEAPPQEVLTQGWESLRQDGVDPTLVALYEALIAASRRTAEVLGQEDVFELERKTALDDMGQRIALRQVLQAATLLEATLPRHRVRPLNRRMEVPTRILDEDTYPVGGYTSLATRGSIESLLHSQLAYMEDDAERPDLFDVKYVRDELLFYARDENQFLRRRRTFVFVLGPDLAATRFKDADLPYQRGVMLLALLTVVVRKLSEWLSTDALSFRFLFTDTGEADPVEKERQLTRTVLHEPISTGVVTVERVPAGRVAGLCSAWARRSLVHCLVAGTDPAPLDAAETLVTRLRVAGPRPALGDADEELEIPEGDDPVESWSQALQQLLRRWI